MTCQASNWIHSWPYWLSLTLEWHNQQKKHRRSSWCSFWSKLHIWFNFRTFSPLVISLSPLSCSSSVTFSHLHGAPSPSHPTIFDNCACSSQVLRLIPWNPCGHTMYLTMKRYRSFSGGNFPQTPSLSPSNLPSSRSRSRSRRRSRSCRSRSPLRSRSPELQCYPWRLDIHCISHKSQALCRSFTL